jgi:hypothetical protein
MREEKALTRGPKLSARGRWVPVVGHREEGRVERRGPQGKMGLGGVLGRAQGERERSRPGARGVGPRLGFQEFSLFFFYFFSVSFSKAFPNRILKAQNKICLSMNAQSSLPTYNEF